MKLHEQAEAFRAAGLSIVTITYDSPELQAAFMEKTGYAQPLLSDIDATSVKALGVLNEENAPGDSNYGIPHPGIFVVDAGGVIRGKQFVAAYSERVEASAVLAYAKQVLGG